MIGHFPCGACRAYVPLYTGCAHWGRKSRGRSEAARLTKLQRDRRYHQQRTPEQGEKKRAADRRYHQEARQRARRDVEEFRRERQIDGQQGQGDPG